MRVRKQRQRRIENVLSAGGRSQRRSGALRLGALGRLQDGALLVAADSDGASSHLGSVVAGPELGVAAVVPELDKAHALGVVTEDMLHLRAAERVDCGLAQTVAIAATHDRAPQQLTGVQESN